MDIYEKCPILENERFKVRLIEEKDADDLLKVYSDINALPFFNSDNCHGSNFYCAVRKDMENTIKYWLLEYHEYKGFVRFSIVDRQAQEAIGTIEMFRREADMLYEIVSLVTEPFYDWFGCTDIATKAPVYAVERIEALKKAGFEKSEEPLIGHVQQRAYYDYWVIRKA